MDALCKTGNDDLLVRRRIGEVLNMLTPPSAFFAPRLLGRGALGSLRRWLKQRSAAAQPIPTMPPTLVPL
jgi:hypothetical protein